MDVNKTTLVGRFWSPMYLMKQKTHQPPLQLCEVEWKGGYHYWKMKYTTLLMEEKFIPVRMSPSKFVISIKTDNSPWRKIKDSLFAIQILSFNAYPDDGERCGLYDVV